jgi:hypothetical protein
MKNIHVIPTEKPSKLFKDDFGKYFISINIDQEQNHFKPQHIYITSSEEIKEGDSIFETDINTINIAGKDYVENEVDFKIILTTDQDLIKDGVQAIDDEFLEWFVKNPNCEFVETSFACLEERQCMCESNENCLKIGYEIIITQEEPKSSCPKCRTTDFINCHSMQCPMRKEELKPIHQQIIDLVGGEERCKELLGIKPKKETLEEFISLSVTPEGLDQFSYDKGLEDGAKWQAERMYSEEEVLKLFSDYRIYFDLYRNIQVLPTMFSEWFEQFKKK